MTINFSVKYHKKSNYYSVSTTITSSNGTSSIVDADDLDTLDDVKKYINSVLDHYYKL
jgi:hypothetical protein